MHLYYSKNGSNIFIHQRLTYKKREGGWVGGWERHKNNRSEENRRRSRGDPDFSSFLFNPSSFYTPLTRLTRIKYK
jgi:hypothetical protein